MAAWSMAQAERLLGIKESVIRHWESEIPLIRPRKGPTGRREYGERDLALLLRVKHLVQDRKLSLAAARDTLLEELSGQGQDSLAALSEIRTELLRLFLDLKK